MKKLLLFFFIAASFASFAFSQNKNGGKMKIIMDGKTYSDR